MARNVATLGMGTRTGNASTIGADFDRPLPLRTTTICFGRLRYGGLPFRLRSRNGLENGLLSFRRESIIRNVKDMNSTARQRGRNYIPRVPDEFYHSILFWTELLRAERRAVSRPLPSVTEMYLAVFCRVVYLNWYVEMRYHPNRATRADAEEMSEAVGWLFDNRVELGI